MRGLWVLIPGCSPDEAGGEERSKGASIRQGGTRPSCRALRATQMLLVPLQQLGEENGASNVFKAKANS